MRAVDRAPEYVRAQALADLLSVSKRTIMRWAGDGMPCSQIGRVTVYPVDAAVAWVAAHGATAAPRRGRPRGARPGGDAG